ncbi:hypothetical protein [Pendulispora albinea]|uniref:NGO1945-like C-terminal domain-containing protein n=1 Tax=Pendulispora albinea TaxID=2741071 RepID=A0ABZ2LVQ7_9BACT
MDEAREQLITAICLFPDEETAVERGLDAADLSPEERAHFEAHARRLLLYRRLVRGNLEGAARRLLPRTVACLERCGAFERELGAFFAEACTRTHYLRDMGAELVRWGVPRWSGADFPRHLADLARYEALELDVAIAAPAPAPAARDELALDRAVVFEPTARLAHFAHAVHEEDGDPPSARAATVLVFRDREHAVHTREIAPDVAPVLERLLAGATLAHAVRGESSAAIDDALLARVAEALAALADEHILLGASA